ncbi:MAG: hypothetical protein JRN11_05305 [Nitrososphaerota archaeon]|nr:hypothetical protein [Nitrososphaerota archaeon]MDG7026147.1 hypothetical protein [Nitrososphaerota archaeon]
MSTLSRSKHRNLLDDPNFRRWCENVARGTACPPRRLAPALVATQLT